MRRLAFFLSRSDAGAVLRALIAQAQHDPAFAATFRARYLDEQRRRDRLPLERAAARGDLPAGFDVAAAADRLVGPIYYRVLVTGDPVDDAYADHLVQTFLAGIRADLTRIGEDRVRELVEHAWRNRAPKRLVTAYDAG